MTQQLTYESWSDYLYRLSAVCGPAELQATLTGTLCYGKPSAGDNWLTVTFELMDILDDDVGPDVKDTLSAFHDLTAGQLRDSNLSYQLLLPDDAVPLTMRNQALAQWCRGFLFGFGASGQPVVERLDEGAQESLRDIAAIASVDAEVEESDENEVYYTELVEYIRMAVFAIYEQLNPPIDDGPAVQ